MTETSLFWTDDGGDSGPYSADQTREIGYLLGGLTGDNAGPLVGVADGLRISNPVVGEVHVLPGAAVVDGTLYTNDATIALSPTTPTVGTTGKRVVLQKDWSAKTVRAVVIASADGVADIPSLTQTAGTTWEIPLAQFQQETSGAIINLKNEALFVSPVRGLRASYARIILGDFWCMGEPPAAGATTSLDGRWGAIVDAGASITRVTGVSPARWQLSTGTTSGEDARLQLGALTQGDGVIAPEHNPHFVAHCQIPSQTELAFVLAGFVDAFSSTPSGAYVRRTTTGDAEFVTRQGGSETTTVVSAIGSTAVEVIEIRTLDRGVTWECLVNGVVAATHTTNVPTATSALAALVGLQNNTTVAVTQLLEHVWVDADHFKALT